MHPNASECIRTDPKSENLENFAKTSKNRKNFEYIRKKNACRLFVVQSFSSLAQDRQPLLRKFAIQILTKVLHR